jgi:thiamine-monophosphate kinase
VREFDLIDRYFSGLTNTDTSVNCGIGDDAAVIDIPPDQELLVSVDTLVSGIHFSPTSTAYDIGYKSLAVNISDIAAMGGVPRWATLALTLPKVEPEWLQAFANGFADIANKYAVSLIGGDTTQGPLSITIQIMGTAEKGKSVLRSGAKPGDLIYVSGCLGAAGLACKTLKAYPDDQTIPSHCLERLHRPVPRVELGQHLGGLATAAIDISDGLAADLGHILKSSAVAAQVQLAAVPVCEELLKLEDRELAWQIALAAGDDYELCFTIAAERQAELEQSLKQLNYPVACIGKITAGEGISWLQESGTEVKLQLDGYQHF